MGGDPIRRSGGQASESSSDDSTEDAATAVGQALQVLETRAEHLARHSAPEEQKTAKGVGII